MGVKKISGDTKLGLGACLITGNSFTPLKALYLRRHYYEINLPIEGSVNHFFVAPIHKPMPTTARFTKPSCIQVLSRTKLPDFSYKAGTDSFKIAFKLCLLKMF